MQGPAALVVFGGACGDEDKGGVTAGAGLCDPALKVLKYFGLEVLRASVVGWRAPGIRQVFG